METLDHIDGERRRSKLRKRLRFILGPRTLRVVLALMPLLTKVVQLVLIVIKIFKE
jgi:hypothetical protein